VIAASPLIATATSLLRTRALDAAVGVTDGLRVDDRLLVDRVRGRRLGRIGLDAITVAALVSSMSLIEDVVISSPIRGLYLRWNNTGESF
jgi:hypothetical protein